MASTITTPAGGTTASFAYDPEHRRLQQVSRSGTATTTTTYYWFGQFRFEQVATSSITFWRDYVTGPDGVLGVLANVNTGGVAQPGNFYRIFPDAQGSVNAVTNDGQPSQTMEFDCYDSWGKRRWCSGDDETPAPTTSPDEETTLGYTGEEMLDAVGLVDLNARVYNPVLGRFMSQDPAGLAGGQNPYGYTANNPMSRQDVSGLLSWPNPTAAQCEAAPDCDVAYSASPIIVSYTITVTWPSGSSTSQAAGAPQAQGNAGTGLPGLCGGSVGVSTFVSDQVSGSDSAAPTQSGQSVAGGGTSTPVWEPAYPGEPPPPPLDPNAMPLGEVDVTTIQYRIAVIYGGQRYDSYNFLGHIAIAIRGHGIFSFGTGTILGGSTTDYFAIQNQARSQTIVLVPATEDQMNAAENYLDTFSDPEGIGLCDNCANRVGTALTRAGIDPDPSLDGFPPLPVDTLLRAGLAPGAVDTTVDRFGSIPNDFKLGPFNPQTVGN